MVKTMSNRLYRKRRTRERPPAAIGRIIDEVCADDRRYFEARPDETERIRPYVDGELWPHFPPLGVYVMIVVQQVAPGVRARIPITDLRADHEESCVGLTQ
jgi:hypothetical protein